MHGDRRAAVALLSLQYAGGAALCALAALLPMGIRTPAPVLWVLAAVGAAAAGWLWWRRERVGDRSIHAAVVLMSVLIGVLAWQAGTAVGVVGLGPAMVALAVFAAYFLSQRAARAHAAFLLAVSTAGAIAAEPSGFLVAWLTVVTAVVVLTEVLSRVSGGLRQAAGTDPLTGLANRRSWEAEANRSLAHALRTGEPLTVALIDLDDFKTINDREGHAAGDALLQSLARRWSGQLRAADLLGRYGGDEFVLCLTATDEARSAELLTRLRASHPAAWSAGTATARPGDRLLDLLARADAELYRHKGRRRG